MNEENKKNQLGRSDMSARVPTPMTDAMAMKPAVQRPVEVKVKSDDKMYGGGFVKKYAHGGGVRKVRYT
tara:strand:- start:1512 stop:1718 length:207 start_codon:yes stop_codon:yes gene_type:complete